MKIYSSQKALLKGSYEFHFTFEDIQFCNLFSKCIPHSSCSWIRFPLPTFWRTKSYSFLGLCLCNSAVCRLLSRLYQSGWVCLGSSRCEPVEPAQLVNRSDRRMCSLQQITAIIIPAALWHRGVASFSIALPFLYTNFCFFLVFLHTLLKWPV